MTTEDPSPVELVESYLDHLENSEFEGAAELFTEDAVYIHPPYFIDEAKIQGRDTILEYFRDARGPQDVEHEITGRLVDGNKGLVLGRSRGTVIDGVNHYMGYVETRDGKISYYSIGYRPTD